MIAMILIFFMRLFYRGEKRSGSFAVGLRIYLCDISFPPVLCGEYLSIHPFNIGPQLYQAFINILITPVYLLYILNGTFTLSAEGGD